MCASELDSRLGASGAAGWTCPQLALPAESQSLGVGSELSEIWSPNRLRCLVLALALAFSQSNSEPMRMSAVAMLVARGTSVSYTHLDVYKRQNQERPG